MSNKGITLRSSQRLPKKNSLKEEELSTKLAFYITNTAHLEENEHLNPLLSYFLEFVESLSLLWFIIHPSLNIYSKDNFLVDQLSLILKILNFYEFLADNPDNYSIMLISAFGVMLIVYIPFIFSSFTIITKKKSGFLKYLRKVVNFDFMLSVKCLSGPLIGLSINVLYCNSNNPYHFGQECYTPTYIAYCPLAIILFLMAMHVSIVFSVFYIIKNPFSGSCLSYPNRYYMLTKTLFKIIFPIYFAVKATLGLEFIYIFLVPGLWGFYIFFHRLFSMHSFKHQHFYVQFFMESALLWMGVSSLLSYTINGTPNSESLSFLYSLVCSFLVGYVMVCIEKKLYKDFLEECLQGKVKKQNIERFLLTLINSMLHVPLEEGKISFQIYSKILRYKNKLQVNIRKTGNNDEKYSKKKKKKGELPEKQIYEFLLEQVEKYREECNSFTIKLIRCHLLRLLGLEYYSFHEALELEQEKLSAVDDFALFYFMKGYGLLTQPLNRNSTDLVRMFYYQKESNRLEDLMEQCAANNSDYWEELGEISPSIPKLRSLATNYVSYTDQIAKTYLKVKQILPTSTIPTLTYLHFLLQVGVQLREAIKIREQLKNQLDNGGFNRVLLGGLSGDEVCAIAVDTVGNNLGCITNCNSQVKSLLGYEKTNILGKNIIRLMPKVYAQLHNSFLMHFVREANHHDSTDRLREKKQFRKTKHLIDRTVPALTNDCFLLEIGLHLQIIASQNNSLIIVGFMQKSEETEDGLIMVQATTGEILGISKRFSELMKGKINGKQVISQELGFSSILPSVDIEKIEKQGFQDTLLEIGHLVENDEVKSMSLEVRVQLKKKKIYEGHQLLFYSVGNKKLQKEHKQLVSFNKRRSSNNIKVKQEISNIIGAIREDNQMKNSKSDALILESINCSEVTSCLEGKGGEDLSKEVPLTRKLSEFIDQKERSHFKGSLILLYLVIIFLFSSYLVVMYQLHNKFLTHSHMMYNDNQIISDIAYEQAQINLYANRIWCVQHYHFQTKNFSQFFPSLRSATTILSKSFHEMLDEIAEKQIELHYNELDYHNFHMMKVVNDTFATSTIRFNSIDGISNFINSAQLLLDPKTYQMVQPAKKYHLQMAVYYISANGDSILAELAVQVAKQFNKYFKDACQNELLNTSLLKSGFALIGIFLFVIVARMGKTIGRTKAEIFYFYEKLRLWDVSQMGIKCDQFLSKRGKTLKKKRSSSLLKIFPIKTIVDIIVKQKEKQRTSGKFLPKMDKNGVKSIAGYEIQEEQWQKLKQDLEREELMGKACPTVSLNFDQGSRQRTLLIALTIIIVLLLGAILAISITQQKKSLSLMQNQFSLLTSVSMVRKSLTYMNLFTFKMSTYHPDFSYVPLFNAETEKFYQYSSQTYSALGNTIYKTIYGDVETLQHYFSKDPSIYSVSLLGNVYSKISINLQKNCDKIIEIINTQFQNTFHQTIDNDKQTDLIVLLGLAALALIFIITTRFMYLAPLNEERIKIINMMKIVPAWMVRRSPEATKIIMK